MAEMVWQFRIVGQDGIEHEMGPYLSEDEAQSGWRKFAASSVLYKPIHGSISSRPAEDGEVNKTRRVRERVASHRLYDAVRVVAKQLDPLLAEYDKALAEFLPGSSGGNQVFMELQPLEAAIGREFVRLVKRSKGAGQ